MFKQNISYPGGSLLADQPSADGAITRVVGAFRIHNEINDEIVGID